MKQDGVVENPQEVDSEFETWQHQTLALESYARYLTFWDSVSLIKNKICSFYFTGLSEVLNEL